MTLDRPLGRPLGRRDALIAAGAACVVIPAGSSAASPMPGQLLGADAALGHRLRSGSLPEPTQTEQAEVVVIGGGVAGLSAAWWLRRTGVEDVRVVELERDVGGNAASGRNDVSAYPWGAHYVPLLTAESVHAAALFTDLGIITGRDAAGLPIYDPFALCADPRERLFRNGAWQEDLLPDEGVSETDRAQYAVFFAAMDSFRAARGTDGRKAFAIPIDQSSADEQFRALDRISMADWMQARGWDSAPLMWYVNYGCRDDYGAAATDVSAWAGIHYHASRDGRAGDGVSPQTVLTWPDGNGHIIHRMKAMLGPALCSALAWRVQPTPEGVAVDVFEPRRNAARRIVARAAVLAVPRFVANRLLGRVPNLEQSYAPWMVANVTVGRMPGGRGAPLCWDNVIYGSRSLGYVVATHQSLRQEQRGTVLTYYWPLSDQSPEDARRAALARTLSEWQAMVMEELLAIHPELDGAVERIDVWLWGHGMIRPTPGAIWGSARAATCVHAPPVFFAHSDMSGISIFEEANERGVQAADAARAYLQG